MKTFEHYLVDREKVRHYKSVLYNKLANKVADFLYSLSPDYKIFISYIYTYQRSKHARIDFHIFYDIRFNLEGDPKYKDIIDYISDKFHQYDRGVNVWLHNPPNSWREEKKFISYQLQSYEGILFEEDIDKIEFSKEELDRMIDTKKFGL